jgi:hypothetical protein
MKIVDRKTFLAMPAGTVYSKYKPSVFDAIEIKGESYPDDFWSTQISDSVKARDTGEMFAQLEKAEAGESVELDFNTCYRDGLFDANQLFAVWDRADVEALIERLKGCLTA